MSQPGLGALLAAAGVTPPTPAPTRPQIAKLNFSHEAIMRWLVENPQGSLGECAEHFGYSRSWLSIIIHSDAFRAKYQAMQKEADRLVLDDIPAKMRGTASLALEGLADQVALACEDGSVGHRQFLLETSESLLKSLGYGGGGKVVINAPGAQNVNTNVVDPATLERARQKLLEQRANTAKVIEGESTPVPAPAA